MKSKYQTKQLSLLTLLSFLPTVLFCSIMYIR
nr:MAG TPA: Acrosome formation-associated factor [Caudoviricetes sp.]